MDYITKIALGYAEKGIPVFPCKHNKMPAILGGKGFKDATTNAHKITQWWKEYRGALIGMPTGRVSGFTVVDIDKKSNGLETFARLEKTHGEFPDTMEVVTQSGGKHLYFKHVPGIKNKAHYGGFDGIDIRNDGGYVIAPGSTGYEWVCGQGLGEIEPAELPKWFVDIEKTTRTENPTYNKEPIAPGRRNDSLIRIAGTYRRGLVSFENALELVKKENKERCDPPLSDTEVEQIVKSAYNYEVGPIKVVTGLEEAYDSDYQKPEPIVIKNTKEIKKLNGKNLRWDYHHQSKQAIEEGREPELRPTLNNVINIIQCREELYKVFRYNEFSKTVDLVEYQNWMKGFGLGAIEDEIYPKFREHLTKQFKLEPSRAIIEDAIIACAHNNPYHPIRDYLNSLTWDGTPRIDNWLTTYCKAEDNLYTRQVGRMTLVAACVRIDKPGTKFDSMMILEGNQGCGKTTAVSILGGEWYCEVSLVGKDKDIVEVIRDSWIVGVPELTTFKKQDYESLKAFISRDVDKERLAYGRNATKFPRKCIFIGNINPEEGGYLPDPTGNRRFLPVKVGHIDTDGLRRDRDQIWAEAWHYAKKGEKIYSVDKKYLEMARGEQKKREHIDHMEQEVEQYLKECSENPKFRGITSLEVHKAVFKGSENDFDRRHQIRISKIFSRLEWESGTFRDLDGVPKRGYKPTRGVYETKSDDRPF